MGENKANYENLRTALMQYYNEKVSNNTNYIISLTVAIFTIFFTNNIFSEMKNNPTSIFLVILLVNLFLTLIVHTGTRIFFWSWMGSRLLYVVEEEANKAISDKDAPTQIGKIEKFLTIGFRGQKLKKSEIFRKFSIWSYKHQGYSMLTSFLIIFFIMIISAYLLGYSYLIWIKPSFRL